MIDMPQSVTSVNGMTGDVVIIGGGGGIADPGSNGILARTALNTTSARTITGTTNQVTVTNGDGVSGNPTLSLPTSADETIALSAATDATKVKGFSFTSSSSSTGAGQYAFKLIATKSVADANSYYGLEFTARTTATSGTQTNIYGLFARTTHEANGTAILSNGYGVYARTDNRKTGTITSGYGLYAATPLNDGGGTYGTYYGLRVADQAVAVTNYAIYTGTGAVRLGDATTIYGHTSPGSDSTYTLGTSSRYWSNTYTDRIYLNSTSYLDGGTAGQITVTGNLSIATGSFIKSGANTIFGGNGYNTLLRPDSSGGEIQIQSFAGGNNTIFYDSGSIGLFDGGNIVLGTTTGTKIGTATTQKLGFFNATPVVQPTSTPANATDLATALTLVNDLKSKLVTLGLIA